MIDMAGAKQEVMAAIEELRRDALGGWGRPMIIAGLCVLFAKSKKEEFKAFVQAKKAELGI